jgi:hypothetical protein
MVGGPIRAVKSEYHQGSESIRDNPQEHLIAKGKVAMEPCFVEVPRRNNIEQYMEKIASGSGNSAPAGTFGDRSDSFHEIRRWSVPVRNSTRAAGGGHGAAAFIE